MKTYFKILISFVVTALFITGCGPAYVSTTRSYYNPSYGYNYGDGQPDGYYYNSNTQTYQYQQSTNVVVSRSGLTFNDFYTHLSPHGVWVNIRPYGQVWIANVRNFQPYSSNGHWTYTTYGWTWVSNYSWGWAPFHYGRWGYDNRYGWYWVPGYEWGPAWVAWSSSGDMYGWAPLMPGMNYNVMLSANHFPSSYWTFMPGRHMGSTNIGGYYVNRSNNVRIVNNITIINNYGTENNSRYSRGPNASDVQRYTGRTVEPLRVSSTPDSRSTGVRNDELRVYRPTTSEASSRSTTAPENNRVSTPQTRTQTDQPATRTATPQRSTQQEQPATGTTTTQRSVQSDQSPETREYRPTQEQPRVTNRAAPQTTRQIQRAQSDNVSSQQQQQQQQVQSRQQSQPQQVQQEQEQQPTRRTSTPSPTRR